jgi:hypothetical protein
MSGLRIKAVIEVRISSWGQIGTNGGQMGAICPTEKEGTNRHKGIPVPICPVPNRSVHISQ